MQTCTFIEIVVWVLLFGNMEAVQIENGSRRDYITENRQVEISGARWQCDEWENNWSAHWDLMRDRCATKEQRSGD